MFARWIRKVIGGIRFFLTLLVLIAGTLVIAADMAFGVKLSVQAYGFLGAMLAHVTIFLWRDTDRPTDELELFKQPARPKVGFNAEEEGDPER